MLNLLFPDGVHQDKHDRKLVKASRHKDPALTAHTKRTVAYAMHLITRAERKLYGWWPMSDSLAMRLARLPAEARTKILGSLSTFERALLGYSWDFIGRPEQVIQIDDTADVVLVLAGRAFGKTKLGGNWARAKAESGRAMRGALIGPDEGEIRKYMVEGVSGILSSCPPWHRPEWKCSKGMMQLTWPNGAIVECHTAENAEYRGPNLDWVWWDEPAKCRWLVPLWRNLQLSLRGSGLGMLPPQVLMTGTPLPLEFFRELKKSPTTRFIGGSSLDNRANLPDGYVQKLEAMGDSRHAAQERDGAVLEDEKGTLFPLTVIEQHRIKSPEHMPRRFVRGGVFIDPADSTTDRSDETGIVCEATDEHGHLFVLEARAERFKSEEWAELAFDWREKWANLCDRFDICGEKNKGGELVSATLRLYEENRHLKSGKQRPFEPTPVKLVWSKLSKEERAKPVSQLYDAGRVHHVGVLRIEPEMNTWIPGITRKSPNGLDALVIGAHQLLDLSEPAPTNHAPLLAGIGGAPTTDADRALAELDELFGAREKRDTVWGAL